MLLLASVAAAGWRYRVTRPEVRFDRGATALRNEDWDAVEEYARLLDAGSPDHAALLRGESLLARRQPEKAVRELTAVRADGPLRVRAAGLLGKCFLALGDVRNAHQALTYVVERAPDDVEAHRGLAGIAYDLGQMTTAVAHLERVAEIDPADPRPLRLMGLIYKDLAQVEKMEAAYQEAIRRGLSRAARAEVALELAEGRLQDRRYADALAELDAVAGGEAERPEAAALRIEALRGLGDRDKAFALADRLAAAAPNDGPFHRLRGQMLLDRGDPAAAAADLEQAAVRVPNHYQTHFLLAQAYTALGRSADADRENARATALRADLDRVTALTKDAIARPWDPGVRRQLAEAMDRMGEPKLAAMWRAAAAACAAPP